ncbi:MAG: MFS transporter [Thermomicrobiales bacterium]
MTSRSSVNQSGISSGLVFLLAAASGLSAANLYYSQPLLHTIAEEFDVGSATAGLIVTFTQIGYAIGLILLVPLGDILQRRKLTFALLVCTTLMLVLTALSPGIEVMIGLAAMIGLGSVATQVLVPMAASLASNETRGRVVGTVMTGLMIGILLARTVSGVVGDAFGWRAVYWLAAAVSLSLAFTLLRRLPVDPERTSLPYPALLRSIGTLIREEPVLRQRMLFAALAFAAFSGLWTTIAFLLSEPPYAYSDRVIGLFGLVGAAGALMANRAGFFVDRGWGHLTTGLFAAGIAISYGFIYLGQTSLAALLVGILLVDVAIAGLQVTNQSFIYQLAPESRSRVTACYITSYFLGGAIGSALAAAIYDSGAGWAGVCLIGAALGVAILVAHLFFRRQASADRTGRPLEITTQG